jgi:uncharacterized protein YeaO (DUF488 family)
MIKTKRFNDPVEDDDGYRLLITRYRPRGIRSEDETWDGWLPQLGPSKELHADAYGKNGRTITFDEYRERYLREMESQGFLIDGLADRVKSGEALTLMCSSACVDAERCHRSILKGLIEQALEVPTRRDASRASPGTSSGGAGSPRRGRLQRR